MIKLGSALIIIASVLWFFSYFTILIPDVIPIFFTFLISIILGIIGAVFTFIGVLKDRLKENKEEEENNDYRQY